VWELWLGRGLLGVCEVELFGGWGGRVGEGAWGCWGKVLGGGVRGVGGVRGEWWGGGVFKVCADGKSSGRWEKWERGRGLGEWLPRENCGGVMFVEVGFAF